jgi:hypothetical protein
VKVIPKRRRAASRGSLSEGKMLDGLRRPALLLQVCPKSVELVDGDVHRGESFNLAFGGAASMWVRVMRSCQHNPS